MLYAILAYHVEAEVMSWTAEQDATVMSGLMAVHDRLHVERLLGPAARLGGTADEGVALSTVSVTVALVALPSVLVMTT